MPRISTLQYILFFLCVSVLFLPNGAKAQADSMNTVNNTIADSDQLLDYQLSQTQFLYYYGTDDTARALINMFFRKRNFFAGIANTDVNGHSNYCIPIVLVFLTDGLAVTYFGVRAAINCSIYTRQSLLYLLVDRENGYEVPDSYLRKLRNSDFDH